MRSGRKAQLARKRLLRGLKVGQIDILAPHVLQVCREIDPGAVVFGLNIGFQDGSVLWRGRRWCKGPEGRFGYYNTLTAYTVTC